jgi:hypothetical protein
VNNDLFETRVLIRNDTGCLSCLIIEPWGEELALLAGDRVSVTGRCPEDGGIMELVYEGRTLIIHAWSGATLTFTLSGQVLDTASSVIASL